MRASNLIKNDESTILRQSFNSKKQRPPVPPPPVSLAKKSDLSELSCSSKIENAKFILSLF